MLGDKTLQSPSEEPCDFHLLNIQPPISWTCVWFPFWSDAGASAFLKTKNIYSKIKTKNIWYLPCQLGRLLQFGLLNKCPLHPVHDFASSVTVKCNGKQNKSAVEALIPLRVFIYFFDFYIYKHLSSTICASNWSCFCSVNIPKSQLLAFFSEIA